MEKDFPGNYIQKWRKRGVIWKEESSLLPQNPHLIPRVAAYHLLTI
jgi:hypothetical protein